MNYVFKNYLLAGSGIICAVVTRIDKPLVALLALMVIDFLTGGIIIPLMLKKSPKTENGGASSKVGFIGLARKSLILFFVLTGRVVDYMCGTDIVYVGLVFAFSANEVLSIIENAGVAGITIPEILADGIELLKKGKGGSK